MAACTERSGITMNPWLNLDPQSIRIFDFDLNPRDPDEIVIQEDLDYFVQKARTINVKPTVTIAGDRVFAVNGAPFILAAQRATPPIASIPCHLKSTAGVMAEALKAFAVRDAVGPSAAANMQMLTFYAPLSERERDAVERKIREWRVEMDRDAIGQGTFEAPSFEWSTTLERVFWQDDRLSRFTARHQMPHKTLKRIDRDISPLRSWNGLDFDWYRKFKWDSFFGQTDRIEFPENAVFRTWEYSVSHCSLLIRAQNADNGRNIDLMFAGVDYWQMARQYSNLSLRLPTEDELVFLKRHTEDLAEHRVSVLQANSGERYLVLAAFRWIERNRLPYSEHSLFD